VIKTIIIVVFILMKVFDAVVKYLNDTYLKKELPDNVKDVYDEKEYARFLEYEKAKGKVNFINTSITICIELAFLVFNLYAWLFNQLSAFNMYLQYVIFIAIVSIILLPVSMPFDFYRTFVIEEKFGMNRMTFKTFVLDEIKSLLISVVLNSLLILLIAFFFEKFGMWGTIYIAAILIAVSFVIAAIVIPIMKIFNKFEELKNGELREKLLALCEKYDVKVKKIVIKDASKRTTKSNAFCTGLKKKTISLDDNLVNNYSADEIVAVFAHEFAHAKYKHILKSMPLSILSILVVVICLGLVLSFEGLFTAFGFTGINYYFAELLFTIISWPLSIIMGLISNYVSRKNEYEADAFAAREGYGEDLIKSLKKLNKESLSDINPHPLNVMINYSHPTLSQRIAAIDKIKY